MPLPLVFLLILWYVRFIILITLFTYEFRRNNFNLAINPNCITWHLRDNNGGIRSYNDKSFYDKDEEILRLKLKEWNITPNIYKFIVLNNINGCWTRRNTKIKCWRHS